MFSSKSSGSRINPALSAIPVFERQEIPSHTLLELRLACAAVIKETGPSGAELDAILNQADPLEQYKKEEQHRKDIEKIRLQAARTHVSAFPPVKGARTRDRLSKSNLDSLNISSTSLASPQPIPKSVILKPLIPAASKLPAEAVELDSQSLERKLSRKPVPRREEEKVWKTRPPYEGRSKSVSADYHRYQQQQAHSQNHGRTGASSTSTTRSNTTFDQHASTSQTSFTNTPADVKRSSLQQHPMRSSSRNRTLRPARRDDNSRMPSETDFFSPNPDYEVPSLYHAKLVTRAPSRTRSRAGSIKDSIIGGIRDYIQPRASMDRASRPQSRRSRSITRDNSVTASRSSSMTRNSKEWMRNAASSLRRKGSISSLRSSRGDDEDRSRRRDKGPDLNRRLPPLPGLDSYKEPKKHIAQLLARSKFSPKMTTENSSRNLLSPIQTTQPLPCSQTQPAVSSQTVVNQVKASPDSTSSKHFPRIPFSDAVHDDAAEAVPQPSTSQEIKGSPDLLQEDALRRVVRQRIQQGGLTAEIFDMETDHSGLTRPRSTKQNSWELEQTQAEYIHSGKKSTQQKGDSVKDGAKKGFRGRFSKFMGQGHQDRNSAIASH